MNWRDPYGLCGESGGYPGGWFNPGNWWRGMYTGNPNASDEVYAAGLDGAAEGLIGGLSIIGNSFSFGLSDNLGWTDSTQYQGWEYTASRISAGIGTGAAYSAVGAGVAQAKGLINATPQGNNVFRIISQPLRRGFRIDKPHHGKWYHLHSWKW